LATQLETKRKTTPSNRSSTSRSSSADTLSDSSWIEKIAVLLLVGGISWVYWRDLVTMRTQWDSNPHYSHGYLVPLFAMILLFARRGEFRPSCWNPSWAGLFLLASGLGLKIVSSYYYIESLSHLSLVVVLAAVPFVIWGTKGFQWALPGVAFLVFMLPLPHRLEGAMQGPLRSAGTKAGTYFLQTIGIPAFNEGYVIKVGQQSIGVAEACSGLNMLMVFFALSTAVALMLTESWLFRFILVISAIPIAIATNILRIAVTAAVLVSLSDTTIFGMPGSEFAHRFFHDWAGWFMMPMGLLILWLEIWILEHLVVRVPDRPVSALGTHSLGAASN
jgi:exosortase